MSERPTREFYAVGPSVMNDAGTGEYATLVPAEFVVDPEVARAVAQQPKDLEGHTALAHSLNLGCE